LWPEAWHCSLDDVRFIREFLSFTISPFLFFSCHFLHLIFANRSCRMHILQREGDNTMAKEAHHKAAEHHDNAAKAHRTAAEHHEKGDNETAQKHSQTAHEHSTKAHESSTEAHNKSREKRSAA
jgi:hypothetical protein